MCTVILKLVSGSLYYRDSIMSIGGIHFGGEVSDRYFGKMLQVVELISTT